MMKALSPFIFVIIASVSGLPSQSFADESVPASSWESLEREAVAALPKELVDMLNKQVSYELDLGYAYLDIANLFYLQNLDGFGQWFTAQYYEEINHARRIMTFLKKRNADISLGTINKTESFDRSTPASIYASGLALEIAHTGALSAIYERAKQLKQNDTTAFLQDFLNEQVAEEDLFRNIKDRLDLLKGDPTGLLALDRELAARAIPAAFTGKIP